MKSHILHYWPKRASVYGTTVKWESIKTARLQLELAIRAAGFTIEYHDDGHDVEVEVVFRDDAEAALFKLTFL